MRMPKRFPMKSTTETIDHAYYQRAPYHPGIVLRDVLMVGFKISANSLSKRSGLSIDEINELLSGRLSVTPSIVNSLEKALGRAAKPLLGLQKEFDYFAKNGRRSFHPNDFPQASSFKKETRFKTFATRGSKSDADKQFPQSDAVIAKRISLTKKPYELE